LGKLFQAKKSISRLIHPLRLIVMDPMRRVEELDAVEVGHVFAVGLGEFGAEV
jgi:hypothetical protein